MIASFQDMFVALATKATLRTQFATDPEAALAGATLDASERAALLALDRAALERYALSLVAKRWSEVAKVVPLTLRVAPSLPASFRRWALDHPMIAHDHTMSPGLAGALHALASLRNRMCLDERNARYAGDLVVFEVWRALSRVDGKVRVLRSHSALDEIAADLSRGLVPIDPDRADTEFRFERGRVQRRPA